MPLPPGGVSPARRHRRPRFTPAHASTSSSGRATWRRLSNDNTLPAPPRRLTGPSRAPGRECPATTAPARNRTSAMETGNKGITLALDGHKRWLLGALLVPALLGGVWFFLHANRAKGLADPAKARQEGRPLPVRTGYVEEKEVAVTIGATAVTIPSFTTVIRIPPTGGLSVRYVPPVTDMVIKAVHVQDGAYVRTGQLLFETDNEFFQKVLEQRKSAVAAAESQLERAKLSVEYNRKVRQKELDSAESEVKFRTEDLVNRQKVFEVLAKLEPGRATNKIDYYDVKSKLEKAQFDLAEARRRLEWARDSMNIGPFQDKEELDRATK